MLALQRTCENNPKQQQYNITYASHNFYRRLISLPSSRPAPPAANDTAARATQNKTTCPLVGKASTAVTKQIVSKINTLTAEHHQQPPEAGPSQGPRNTKQVGACTCDNAQCTDRTDAEKQHDASQNNTAVLRPSSRHPPPVANNSTTTLRETCPQSDLS